MPKTPQQLMAEAERLATQEREAREKLNTLRPKLRHLALSGTVTDADKKKLLVLARYRQRGAKRNPGRAASGG
jgi:hypothetical protein